MNEKRKHDRKTKTIKFEVHAEDSMTYSTSIDMSHGGLFISTPEPVHIGTEVNLLLHTGSDGEFSIKGVVRWLTEQDNDEKKIGMGIEFIDISEEKLEQIEAILKT